jgi:hypothetical protein
MGPRPSGAHSAERVVLPVELVDAPQRKLGELAGGDLAAPHELGLTGDAGRGRVQIAHQASKTSFVHSPCANIAR